MIPAAQQVSLAFGLGWHVAELFHFEKLPGESDTNDTDRLPGIGRLSQTERAQLLEMQISVALKQIGSEVSLAAVQPEADKEAPRQSELKAAVEVLHLSLLKTLTAQDARIGKAYGLGRALAETMLVPLASEPGVLFAQFQSFRIQTLQAQLVDLRAQFPSHAAETVESTLGAWADWVSAHRLEEGEVNWDAAQRRTVSQALRRQGEQWYGLLSGEIDALGLLRLHDYDLAASLLIKSIARFALTFLTATWVGAALVVLAVLVGILVITVSVTGHLAALAGSSILLLGALGITTAGVTSAVRQILTSAELPLWRAALTQAVAAAALNLPRIESPSKREGTLSR